jgi:hypothetical protein
MAIATDPSRPKCIRRGGDASRHNSDVEADVALSRCAPSGPRSLTPVVMRTAECRDWTVRDTNGDSMFQADSNRLCRLSEAKRDRSLA